MKQQKIALWYKLEFKTTKPLEETFKLRVISSKNRIYHAQAKGYLKAIEIKFFT